MIDTIPRPDATLPEFLAARARHASDARLAAYAVSGFIAVIVAALWRGPGWLLLVDGGATIMCFGFWGVTDRELGERAAGVENASRRTIMALRVTRAIVAVLGFAAAVLFMLTFVGVALGRMIS